MSGPTSLEQLTISIKQWRATKKFRERIPEELWKQIVVVAKAHPLSKVSKAAGLDFYQLRSRLEKGSCSETAIAPVNVTKFVAPLQRATSPLVEVETSTGAKVRFFDDCDAMRAVIKAALGG
jgi:hypothetical protein